MKDRIDCFARRNESNCNALAYKNCEDCRFYKHRNKIKNNPFYAYSYDNREQMIKDIKKYNIKSEQMILK